MSSFAFSLFSTHSSHFLCSIRRHNEHSLLIFREINMKKFALALSALLLVGAYHPAQAQEERRKPPSFEEMDANGDGLLTKDELKGRLLDELDLLDSDGDGALSESELPEPPKRRN
jgi:hypothetical protein